MTISVQGADAQPMQQGRSSVVVCARVLTPPPRGRPIASWLLVAVWSVVIYRTIPFARAVQKQVAGSSYGSEAFQHAVVAIFVLAVVLTVRAARRRIWLVLIAGIFIYYTLQLKSSPEEAVHFVEYGILGILIYRALTHSI